MPEQARCLFMETCHQGLKLRIDRDAMGLTPTAVWNPSPSLHHRTTPHELPMSLKLGVRDNMHCASRFSPPPFSQHTRPIDPQHLKEIAIAWQNYLDKLKHTSTVASEPLTTQGQQAETP